MIAFILSCHLIQNIHFALFLKLYIYKPPLCSSRVDIVDSLSYVTWEPISPPWYTLWELNNTQQIDQLFHEDMPSFLNETTEVSIFILKKGKIFFLHLAFTRFFFVCFLMHLPLPDHRDE